MTNSFAARATVASAAPPSRPTVDGTVPILPSPRPPANEAFAVALAKVTSKEAQCDEPAAALVTGPSALHAATAQTTPSAATGLDAHALDHLDRIVAAIAEARGVGIESEVHVQLPAGPLPLEAAVIGRDATGQLAVVLIQQGAVPPATGAALAHDLREHLLRRDLRARVTAQSAPRSAAARSIS